MKRSNILIVSLLVVLLAMHITFHIKAGTVKKNMPLFDGPLFVMPSPLLKIGSLEFKGFVSDMLFLKAIVFYGGTFERTERPRVKEREWTWFHAVLEASTDLDPFFFDPYFVANAVMTWEGGLIRETNALLEKGTHSRDWDWMLPFFIGFNNFYFLHDNAEAARSLMESSQRPGASPQIASLAARLAYKGRMTENAIIFLEAIMKKTDDEHLRKEFAGRLQALQARRLLEIAVERYRSKYGAAPASVGSLVKRGIIDDVPQDPYGGEFSIDRTGAIRATSDNLLMPRQR